MGVGGAVLGEDDCCRSPLVTAGKRPPRVLWVVAWVDGTVSAARTRAELNETYPLLPNISRYVLSPPRKPRKPRRRSQRKGEG